MTNRQLRFHALLRPHVPDVVKVARRELADRPVGSVVVIPFRYPPFETRKEALQMNGLMPLRVMVAKGPDGLLYREDGPFFFRGKGRTEPPFRVLSSS